MARGAVAHWFADVLALVLAPGAVLERSSKVFFLEDVIRGFWIGAESMAQPPLTINYPMEKGAISPRFRGEHALRRYPSGEER